jgi:hypothetical protein
MSQTTQNSQALIVQQLYSSTLLESFPEQLMDAGMLYNDRTAEFPEGERLNINQIGDITLSPYAENTPLDFSAIDTSRIYLQVSEYDQDAWYITDKLREDAASQVPGMISSRMRKSVEAFRQKLISDILSTQDQQTPSDPNLINDQPHRFVASGGSDTARKMTLDDLRLIKLAFDEANIPANGRVAFVDPTVEYEFNDLSQVVTADNPRFQGIVETGFADRNSMQFIRNIYGWDIMVTTMLPRVGAETIDAGDGSRSTGTKGVANMFMYIGDDEGKPFMGVIRKQPTAGMKRNDDLQRDEHWAVSRWGFALQRPETLGVILTDK